jgi:RNA polymerase II subunit A small phosphatase-like protein
MTAADRPRKLLVLDLDETLVFASMTPLARDADLRLPGFHVYFRPGLEAFLERAASCFRLAVWTSASRDYALAIAGAVFTRHRPEFVWSVERCTNRRRLEHGDSVWLKDLGKLRRRGESLAAVLVVDDSPEKLARSYGNLVRVEAWLGDPSDGELPLLATYLELLNAVDDVRIVEKRTWRNDARAGTLGR